jgi:hypothetical protein
MTVYIIFVLAVIAALIIASGFHVNTQNLAIAELTAELDEPMPTYHDSIKFIK